jgi:hypothetical protein
MAIIVKADFGQIADELIRIKTSFLQQNWGDNIINQTINSTTTIKQFCNTSNPGTGKLTFPQADYSTLSRAVLLLGW